MTIKITNEQLATIVQAPKNTLILNAQITDEDDTLGFQLPIQQVEDGWEIQKFTKEDDSVYQRIVDSMLQLAQQKIK